jgi:hypothetical protein
MLSEPPTNMKEEVHGKVSDGRCSGSSYNERGRRRRRKKGHD